PERFERLADEFLVDEWAVHLGGVEERDTTFDGRAQQGDVRRPIRPRAVALAHPHGAEPDRRDAQTVAEVTLQHGRPLSSRIASQPATIANHDSPCTGAGAGWACPVAGAARL